jgi:hypothetical protein
LVVSGWYLRRSGTFLVGEQGIRFESSSGIQELMYGEMTESCQMYRSRASVGIAVRSQSQPHWISALDHLSGH